MSPIPGGGFSSNELGVRDAPDDQQLWGTPIEWIDDKGKPSQQGVGQEVKGVFMRQLRDYWGIFRALDWQRLTLQLEIAALDRDLKYAETGQANAESLRTAAQNQVDVSQTELAEVTRKRGVLEAHQKALDAKVKAFKASVEDLIRSNSALAAQIAKIQLDAARKIDARTGAMVRSGEASP